MSLRIDAHQHFWQPARGDYAWLRPDDASLAPLLRDFLPEHLHGHLQAHGMERGWIVQIDDGLLGNLVIGHVQEDVVIGAQAGGAPVDFHDFSVPVSRSCL